MQSDTFDLARFVWAQDPVFPTVLAELRAGRKESHWMWFVFPQLAGLGQSPMARRYAIGALAEARAYLDHPVLGPRLVACTAFVNETHGQSASNIFGAPDDAKFRSSMTLFSVASSQATVFDAALGRFFGGIPDQRTLSILDQSRQT